MAKATKTATATAPTTRESLTAAIAAVPLHGLDKIAVTAQLAAVGWQVVPSRSKSVLQVVPTADAQPAGIVIMLAYAGVAMETKLVAQLGKLAMVNDWPAWAAKFDEITGYSGDAKKRFTADDNPTYGRLRSRSRKMLFVLPCCVGHTPSGDANGGTATTESKAAAIDDDLLDMLDLS